MLFSFLIVLVLSIILAGAVYTHKRINLIRRGKQTVGTVVSLKVHAFQLHQVYPVVRFQTSAGRWLTLPAKSSAIFGDFNIGQRVPVRYQVADPQNFVVLSGLDLLL